MLEEPQEFEGVAAANDAGALELGGNPNRTRAGSDVDESLGAWAEGRIEKEERAQGENENKHQQSTKLHSGTSSLLEE